MEVKILKPILKYKVGDVVTVVCDEKGTPKDRYWRKRFKDAEIDNCLQKIEEKKTAKGGR